MHLDKKPTSDEMRQARKAGFRRRRPKKPKMSSSKNALENYAGRYNDWCKGMRQAVKDGKEREKLQEQIRRI